MTDQFDAIADVLHLYFDGLYHSDTERLSRVFHPMARYICATEEPLINLSMGEYFPIVDARTAPAAAGQSRHDRIQSIAFAGPNTAFAVVNCAIGEKHFTDFLTLIRTDGDWRIISKVFHYDLEASDS
ncbi:MAG: nuclear transport factor 2 family protein [Fimbriimonadaceae bacterium]|nr:nuclear transport factor 2 family protein [Alphaproteobacteria bacterium]